MSAEALASTGAEFRARPVQTTERGTEVSPSSTGNRLIDVASRVASFLDRFKVGRQETLENAQDAAERGKQFVRTTGEKAVQIAIIGGDIALGTAVLATEATVRGAKKVGEWTGEKFDAAKEMSAEASNKAGNAIGDVVLGVGNIAQTAKNKVEQGLYSLNDAIDSTGTRISETVSNGIDFAKQKGANAKEAAVNSVEAVKSFFKAQAEAAKSRREARRERWDARVNRGKEAASAAALRGREAAAEAAEKGKEFRAKAQKRGHAIRMAAQAAQIVYSANVRS